MARNATETGARGQSASRRGSNKQARATLQSEASDRPELSLRPVLLLGLFTFAGLVFTTFLDLGRFPIAGSDEIGYLNAGLNKLSDQWNIYSFPIHSLTYAVTGLFEADPIRNYKLNAFVPFFIMVFLLQLYMLRATGSTLLSVLVTAPLLLSTDIGVTAWPHANQTVCIVFLSGLLLIPRQGPVSAILACLVTMYFLMAFTRSEQMLALYLACMLGGAGLLLALIKLRSMSAWARLFLPPLALSGALIVALSALMGSPVLLDKYRSLSAFSQHYAYGLSLRTEIEEHPWTEHRAVFERAFGDTTSISGAIQANPAEFIAHVASNIRQLGQWAIGSDPVGGIGWLLALLFFLAAIVAFLRRLWRAWNDGEYDALDAGRLICLAAPVPSIILLLLIFPRANYLQMGYVMLAATAVLLLRPSDVPSVLKSPGTSALSLLAAIGILALVTPVPERADPHEAVLKTLRQDILLQGKEQLSVAATTGICAFQTTQCTEQRILHTRADLSASLDDQTLDYIVLVQHPDAGGTQEDLTPYLDDRFAAGTLPQWSALAAPDGWHLLRRGPP